MFIDENTARDVLLGAVYSDGLLIDYFMLKDLDPEHMTTDALRAEIIEWISIGDECGEC